MCLIFSGENPQVLDSLQQLFEKAVTFTNRAKFVRIRWCLLGCGPRWSIESIGVIMVALGACNFTRKHLHVQAVAMSSKEWPVQSMFWSLGWFRVDQGLMQCRAISSIICLWVVLGHQPSWTFNRRSSIRIWWLSHAVGCALVGAWRRGSCQAMFQKAWWRGDRPQAEQHVLHALAVSEPYFCPSLVRTLTDLCSSMYGLFTYVDPINLSQM